MTQKKAILSPLGGWGSSVNLQCHIKSTQVQFGSSSSLGLRWNRWSRHEGTGTWCGLVFRSGTVHSFHIFPLTLLITDVFVCMCVIYDWFYCFFFFALSSLGLCECWIVYITISVQQYTLFPFFFVICGFLSIAQCYSYPKNKIKGFLSLPSDSSSSPVSGRAGTGGSPGVQLPGLRWTRFFFRVGPVPICPGELQLQVGR